MITQKLWHQNLEFGKAENNTKLRKVDPKKGASAPLQDFQVYLEKGGPGSKERFGTF